MWLSIKTQNSNIHFRCDQFLIRYRTFSGIGMVLLYSPSSQLVSCETCMYMTLKLYLVTRDFLLIVLRILTFGCLWTRDSSECALHAPVTDIKILSFRQSKKNYFFCWLSHLLHFYLESFILRFVIENSRIDSFYIIYVPYITDTCPILTYTEGIYLRKVTLLQHYLSSQVLLSGKYNSNSPIKSKNLPPMLIFALMRGL